MSHLEHLPESLPVPINDGACDHLLGMALPAISLTGTDDAEVDLSNFVNVVIYCYPMTGRPDISLPEEWDNIPGARGCTPQSCAFRDHYQELSALGANVFGLSSQESAYQQEAKERLHLPYTLLSDKDLAYTKALNLPTFTIDNNPSKQGRVLLKRVTLIAQQGMIKKVFYPVFPPHKNVEQVLTYLRATALHSRT